MQTAIHVSPVGDLNPFSDDLPVDDDPEAAKVERVLTADGFWVDADTGEVLGVEGHEDRPGDGPEVFIVSDIESAEWVLERMQGVDAEIVKLQEIKAARVAALDDMILSQTRRREWLDRRFGSELEHFAATALAREKGRTLKTAFGKLSFRLGQVRIAVKEGVMAQAVAWARKAIPTAVKTPDPYILVSELRGAPALPTELFDVIPAEDRFSIDTGIKVKK